MDDGKMRVCFVNLLEDINKSREHPRHTIAPLDIGYSAALLEKKGHATYFIDSLKDCKDFEDLVNKTNALNPDIIIIKPYLGTHKTTCKLADRIKTASRAEKGSRKRVVFLIGPAAYLYPNVYLFPGSGVDLIVNEEPELTIMELVDKTQRDRTTAQINPGRNMRGIIYYDALKKRIIQTRVNETIRYPDSLPFPKHDFFLAKHYEFFYPLNINKKLRLGYILTSRGCPYKCLFCSPIERASVGRLYRHRTAKNVVDELELLQGKGVNAVYFSDDLLFVSENQIKGLCAGMIKRNIRIKWAAQARIDLLNKEIICLMKKAGCSTLCLGVESGSPRILKKINKNTTISQIQRVFQWLNRAGILTVAFVVLGTPGEREEDIEATFKLIKSIKPDFLQIHFFTPYAGSPYSLSLGFAKGLAKNTDMAGLGASKFKLSDNLCSVPYEKLFILHKRLYKEFYLSPRFFFNYGVKRLPHLLLNIRAQKKLIITALRFFL